MRSSRRDSLAVVTAKQCLQQFMTEMDYRASQALITTEIEPLRGAEALQQAPRQRRPAGNVARRRT